MRASDKAPGGRWWQGEAIVAVVLGAATFALLLPAMSSGSLFDSDDAIYAQMAREMRAAGDLLDNRWCGVVQFEKPPLLFWGLTASMALFGEGEAALRLPGTLAAAASVSALFLLATGLGLDRRRALLAAGLWATTGLFVLMSRRVMTDLPLVAALLFGAAFVARERAALAGASLGLAVLAKGPAAAPLALTIALWGLATRALPWRKAAVLAGVGLLVAAPWHVVETVRHGADFWNGYVGYHAFGRATRSVVPGLDLQSFLSILGREWLIVALGTLGLGLAIVRRPENGRLAAFAAVWLAVALALPLFSTTRLPHYALPALPALALLAGLVVPERLATERLFPIAAFALLAAAIALGPGTLAFWLDPDFGPDTRAAGVSMRGQDGPIIAGNLGNQALTWYSGRCATIVSSDARFLEIQRAVLLNVRAGVVAEPPGPLAAAGARTLVLSADAEPGSFLVGAAPGDWAKARFGDLVVWRTSR